MSEIDRASSPSGPCGLRDSHLEYARDVIAAEAQAVANLAGLLDDKFDSAVELLAACRRGGDSRAVATGIGKAGIVARKVSATLASTGTPAVFMHPSDALHGDLGMIGCRDVVIVFSNSGESDEIALLLPAIRRLGCHLIAVTGNRGSRLACHADIVLWIGCIEEPCPLGLAPSASSTAMLALGDALALCLLKMRGLTTDDYAQLHPGGALGRKLLVAEDVMRTGNRLAVATPTMPLFEGISRMTAARSGAIVIVDAEERIAGIFTDGDLRRLVGKGLPSLPPLLRDCMTSPCKHVPRKMRVVRAEKIMAEMRINSLPVVDEDNKVVGILDIQDLVAGTVMERVKRAA
jgi:arabinose-5-phosphate isomerase